MIEKTKENQKWIERVQEKLELRKQRESLTPVERVLTSLEHKEPDRVPYDLGSSPITGIHEFAYANLLRLLGKNHLLSDQEKAPPYNLVEGLATVHEEILDAFGVDVHGFKPSNPSSWSLEENQGETEINDKEYWTFTDEFGMAWFKPKRSGWYYDQLPGRDGGHPMYDFSSLEEIENYPWPDMNDEQRYERLREKIQKITTNKQRAILMGTPIAGVHSLCFRLRGYKNHYKDLIRNKNFVHALSNKISELKIEYWQRVFEEVGDLIHICCELDDFGEAENLQISPSMWREMVKPHFEKYVSWFSENKPRDTYFMLHSDGAIREIIPDLIDAGVDILNPVQTDAAGMDLKELKQEFGDDLTFWGGIIEANTLVRSTPEQIRRKVKESLDILMPKGGLVCSQIHNVQPKVPPENYLAFWEAIMHYGWY